MVFAPDALTPLGGFPGDEDKARKAFGTLDQAKTQQDFLAAAGDSGHAATPPAGWVPWAYDGAAASCTCLRRPRKPFFKVQLRAQL